jgi:hypothetical protein
VALVVEGFTVGLLPGVAVEFLVVGAGVGEVLLGVEVGVGEVLLVVVVEEFFVVVVGVTVFAVPLEEDVVDELEVDVGVVELEVVVGVAD